MNENFRLKLVLPNKKYKKSYYELVKSAIKNEDVSELGNAYRENETFEQMLKRLRDRRIGKNISKKDVAATVYFIVVGDKVIGTIDARSYLNESYYADLGHIAYYIKPDERRKGYATKALGLVLKKYKHTNRILVTCTKDNIGSAKVIENNGGILEGIFLSKRFSVEIKRYWITKKVDKVLPKVVWLTINGTCNNKCSWCYAKKYTEYNKMMKLDDIKKCVNQLEKIGVKKVILIGGEPTIHPNIVEIIKELTDHNIKVSMASNGRKFCDFEFAKSLVDAGLCAVNISIKGSNENEYMENTLSHGFKEMLKGYKNLSKLNVNLSLSYVLCNTDISKFEEFWKMCIDNKLDNILFQFYKPSVLERDEDAPTIEHLAELCKKVYERIYNSNINFHFEMSLPLCVLDEKMLKHMIEKKRIYTSCHISRGHGIVFDPEFNILPCNHFVTTPLNDKKVSFDNLVNF